MSNKWGHLLIQADQLPKSFLNQPGGANFTLPALFNP